MTRGTEIHSKLVLGFGYWGVPGESLGVSGRAKEEVYGNVGGSLCVQNKILWEPWVSLELLGGK